MEMFFDQISNYVDVPEKEQRTEIISMDVDGKDCCLRFQSFEKKGAVEVADIIKEPKNLKHTIIFINDDLNIFELDERLEALKYAVKMIEHNLEVLRQQ